MAKKILIIDDDPAIVKYLENLFQNNGYETVSASNGVEGYDAVKDEKPDLITLDLDMPEEWGTRLFRRLTKDKDCKGIPVIVISGLSGRHLAIKNVEASFAKPFDPDKVIAAVRKALGEVTDKE